MYVCMLQILIVIPNTGYMYFRLGKGKGREGEGRGKDYKNIVNQHILL